MKRIIVLSLIVGALTGCPNNSGTPPSAPATTTTHAEGDGHGHGADKTGHAEGDGHGHDHGDDTTERAGG